MRGGLIIQKGFQSTLEERAWLANLLCSEASRKFRAGEGGVDKPLAQLSIHPLPALLQLPSAPLSLVTITVTLQSLVFPMPDVPASGTHYK